MQSEDHNLSESNSRCRMSSNRSQFCLLLRKNLLLTRRSKLWTFFELVFPCLFTLPIVFIVLKFSNVSSSRGQSYIPVPIAGNGDDFITPVGFINKIQSKWCNRETVKVAYNTDVGGPHLKDMIDAFASRFEGSRPKILLEKFPNRLEMLDALRADIANVSESNLCGINTYAAGLYIQELNIQRKAFSYEIMLPSLPKIQAQMHRRCSLDGGHPNILHCYGHQVDISISEFQVFLEFCDGGELYDKIEPGVGVPLAEAQSYFLQLLNGLEFMHRRGIAHRDIKPENLLLSRHNVLKIADFGMATIFRFDGVERDMTTYCGTLPYMAPEVYEQKPYRAEPYDMWSCGMVLVTLLVGELPWAAPEKDDPIFSGWVSGSTLHEDPWKRMDTKALSILRALLIESPVTRADMDRVKSHPWCTTKFGAVGVRSARIHGMIIDQADFDAASQPAHRQRPPKMLKMSAHKAFSQPENIDLLSENQVAEASQAILDPCQWVVRRMTRFCVTLPLSKVHTRLLTACEECGFAVNQTVGNKIVMAIRDVIFIVFIIEMTENGRKRIMLDFRRSRGDGLEFKKAFMVLKNRLQDAICPDGAQWMASQGYIPQPIDEEDEE